MNISGPAAVAKPEMLFYAPGDLTVTTYVSVFYNNKKEYLVTTSNEPFILYYRK